MDQVQKVREQVEQKLKELAPLFIPGTKFTFYARTPIQDGDMLVSNDNGDKVIEGLEFLFASENIH